MEKITYDDVVEYNYLFTFAPSFLLERMAKKNSNLVKKFKSSIQSYMDNLTDIQCVKLNVILDSDVSELQAIMQEAYEKTNKKQYRILANPNYSQFIELNLNELKGMV
ncbi:hypothetical protein [uncultured Methanobrevibacter sp.]|uniref:hypothetical protein n=1 Tax=uncultured Methanobrevibacter sp. TaxID=253161 RepID=UPI0025E3FEA2|nr:hypothetical protein [uncultured Methanobrevibacter sp.]